ncbi:MAG: hypothetical protein ACP5E8_06710 [Thermoplasmata archaeon]
MKSIYVLMEIRGIWKVLRINPSKKACSILPYKTSQVLVWNVSAICP